MDILIKGVMFVVVIITLIIWAFVGFVFWIPLLARSTAVFSATILAVTIANRHEDSRGLGYQLEIATKFYIDGFRMIVEALYARPAGPPENFPKIHFGRVIIEILWAGFFWAVMLRLFSPDLASAVWSSVSDFVTTWYIKLTQGGT
jgi:hypothetical protein